MSSMEGVKKRKEREKTNTERHTEREREVISRNKKMNTKERKSYVTKGKETRHKQDWVGYAAGQPVITSLQTGSERRKTQHTHRHRNEG